MRAEGLLGDQPDTGLITEMEELEALAVVWAVKHFCVYFDGHKCDMYTDHEVLLSLLNTPHPSRKLVRWGLAIQELDLSIHYRPGKLNQSADSLSRCALTEVGCVDVTVDTLPRQTASASELQS